MPEDVKAANHMKLYRYVNKHTAAFWGQSFVQELQRVTAAENMKKVPKVPRNEVISRLIASKKKKVFLLDYDGTLTNLQKLPDFARPSPELIFLLENLASKENAFVYILSGRPREFMDKWFSSLEVGLCAGSTPFNLEHGCFYKHPKKLRIREDDNLGDNLMKSTSRSSSNSSLRDDFIPRHQVSGGWFSLVDQVDSDWRDTIKPMLQHYTERTPGSFIEEKEMNVAWHYRNADPEFGTWQATELHVNLEKILSHSPVSVF
jgi:trehalose 6-phosphate synthase/phosphatase